LKCSEGSLQSNRASKESKHQETNYLHW